MTSKTEPMGTDLELQQTTGTGMFEDINKSDLQPGSGHNIDTYRGLTPRHVQLMAIGGSIGTGVFVGIGNFLQLAGPLNLFLGYIVWSIFFTWPCYLCVAEMVAYLPVRGNIFELATRFVDPALGFCMGESLYQVLALTVYLWTYFFAGAMLVCTEYAAVATVMQFWLPKDAVNPAVWIAVAWVLCWISQTITVRWYGETEFWACSTKLILLVGLILLTFITMVGGNPKHDAYGFRYWGNGMAMHPYMSTGVTGRFLGFWVCARYAAYTISGPDLISLAAGEIQNPRRTVPRVAKLVFYRLCGFYILGAFCVGIICSSRDTGLISARKAGAAGAGASPWVIGIQNLGIEGLPSVINAVILISGWSGGNAYLYASSRSLYSMARDGQAPRIFSRCTKAGVPVWSIAFVQAIGCITFMVTSNAAVTVFFWFVGLTTVAVIITYILMYFTFFGWYRALKAQGISRNKGDTILPHVAPLAPYSQYVGVALGVIMVITCGFDTIKPFDVQNFICDYTGLAFAVITYVFWKFYKKTKVIRPEDVDLHTGKAAIDAECWRWEDPNSPENFKNKLAAMPGWRRWYEKIW